MYVRLYFFKKGNCCLKTRWIPEDDYNAIVAKLPPSDRWLVRLLRATGYRIEDVLRTRRWMWSGTSVCIREAKTGNIRRIAISDGIRRIVEQYEAVTPLKANRLSAFVPGRRGRPGDRNKLHRTTLWRHFQRAAKTAGLGGKGYSLHSLRKCYAVDKLRMTGSIEEVQRDLGHRYISTTLIYLSDALILRNF